MTPQVFRAVICTALCCTVAGWLVLVWNERRHDREAAEARVTGIAPPGHIDLYAAPLEEWEQDALNGIAAATEGRRDAGLGILRRDGEQA